MKKKFLYIITFGIIYFYFRSKAKKKSSTRNNQIIYTKKIDFDLNNFLSMIGGIENIVSTSSTINTLKIKFKKKITIDKKKINNFKIKGFY
jgi:hypothetical protein